MRQALAAAAAVATLAAVALLAASDPAPAPALRLVEAGRGLGQSIQVVSRVADGRLLVVDQDGVVWPLGGGRPFLDLSGHVAAGGEQGLLSIVFHPRQTERRLYVHYTDRAGDSRVVEYLDGPAGPRPTRTLLAVDQPYPNHNGGNLVFGADGHLYLGLGDGGDAFDPDDRSQDPASRLGKLLRLDVDRPGADWAMVALGLRNPWRISLDATTGDLWIADVGQDLQEEVDRLPSGSPGVVDLGWPRHEGDRLHPRRRTSGLGPYLSPEHVYGRRLGCSVVGGPVLRSGPLPLRGRYLYGDLCTGRLWSFPVGEDGRTGPARAEDAVVPGLVSIDATPDGRLFLTSLYGYVYEVLRG